MDEPEKEIKTDENPYRDIVENLSEIILKFNAGGDILFANQGASDISGYMPEELTGMNIADILPPGHYDAICNTLFSNEKYGVPVVSLYEAEFIDRELKLIPVEINAFPLTKDKKPSEYLFSARDITSRKIPENERLRQRYFEVLEIFSSDVAHHLERLFEDIISETDFVRKNSDPQSTVFRRLSDARNACEWGRHMIRDFAEALNPDISGMEKKYLEDMLRKTAVSVAADFGMECEFSIPADLWPVICDETRMARVFHHLVLNAAEAGSPGGKIYISAENISAEKIEKRLKAVVPLEEYVKISVQDQGSGIPESLSDRIFDPYFSTKNRDREDARGLGLATVYSVVRKHRGYVDVRSIPNLKTVFTVYLPVIRSESSTDADSSAKETKNAPSGRILLMDDEDIIREVAGNMLRAMGYQVSFARSGGEAVSLYKAAMLSGESFDMVILDLNVEEEGEDGKNAMQELLKADPDVKAIVSSGYSNDSVMTDCKKYGFAGIVNKPYSFQELKDALKAVLRS